MSRKCLLHSTSEVTKLFRLLRGKPSRFKLLISGNTTTQSTRTAPATSASTFLLFSRLNVQLGLACASFVESRCTWLGAEPPWWKGPTYKRDNNNVAPGAYCCSDSTGYFMGCSQSADYEKYSCRDYPDECEYLGCST